MRDEVFEQAIAPLETRRFIRATVTELVPEYDIMRIEIDGFNYPCFVSTKNLMETYQVGYPINVRLTSKEALKFFVI